MNKLIEHRFQLQLNETIDSHSNTAEYLGITLDAKHRWKEHVKEKCEELKLKKIGWMEI